jgi:hypothetical protein
MIFMAVGDDIESINELESAFKLKVDDFHPNPAELYEYPAPGDTHIKDCCLCHVNLAGYLTAAGATWHWDDYEGGDIEVLMMPPIEPTV